MSNADCLPRDIEFPSSKSRLNITISRAKALAIPVASPDLLSAVPEAGADGPGRHLVCVGALLEVQALGAR